MRRLSLAILAIFLLTTGAVFAQGEATDPTPQSQTTTQSTSPEPAQTESTLPQTASDLPLVAGLGLLALAGAIVIRSSLKKTA
jgi:hypothetical protein